MEMEEYEMEGIEKCKDVGRRNSGENDIGGKVEMWKNKE